MLTYKRTFLILLILMTVVYIGYQLYLIINPILKIDADSKYLALVDQYHVIKMERLLLEEQFALAKTKEKVLNLASSLQQTNLHKHLPNHTLFKSNKLLPIQSTMASLNRTVTPQPVSLSLEQAKTFEQLEAYVSTNKPAQHQLLTNDENNLLTASGGDFTLQLMGVRDITELKRFINDNHLQDAHIFHTYYLSKDWYVLVYGRYKNHTEALKAIETLPNPIQELKPWIRQLASVQKAIQLYRQ